MPREIPQPVPHRITEFAGHPAIVGIVPGQSDLIPLTAAQWARANGDAMLYFAYVDPTRRVVDERPDGSVRHVEMDPDTVDDSWRERQRRLEAAMHALVDPWGMPWELRYLAGRPDRALTHLARAVDAALIVVGTRAPGLREHVREFLAGSVAVQLMHHQHRPVLVVPTRVVDWREPVEW